MRDGQEHVEYQSDDVQDAVYIAVLRQCHSLYQLFNGPLAERAANPGQLKVSLDQFYSRVRHSCYMRQKKLNYKGK
jgi:hypothetical protein